MTRNGSHSSTASTIIDQPIAQITCTKTNWNNVKVQLQLTSVKSSTTSHSPRVIRKRCISARVQPRERQYSHALVPARKTNVGAQKCVIQRVRNSAADAWVRSFG